MTDLDAVSAYAVPPREVPGSESHMISIDQVARQMPTGAATPTPLPDLSSLTLLGKDDGSFNTNSLKIEINQNASFLESNPWF